MVAPLGPRFGVHLSAVALANLADGVVRTGLPLVAIALTRSPLLIGVLTAAAWLPWLVCGLPAGALVDRWDRRRTIMAALGLRGVLLAAVAALAAAGLLTVAWLVVLALLYGVTEVFADLAAMAQVPALVGREPSRLRRANARLLAVQHLFDGFTGPPLAGALLALGSAWVLGAPALAVGAAVVVLAVGLRGRFVAAAYDVGEAAAGAAPATSAVMRHELMSGMTTVWRHPVLRPLLVGAGLWNFASNGFAAVIVLWMVGPGSAGGLTPQEWSLVAVAMPVGAVLGSLASERMVARWPEMRVLVVSWGLNGLLSFVPLVWPSAVGFAVFLLLVGVLGVLGNVVTGSIRPRMVPEHLLGRVGGASRVVGYGAMPLGALVAGQVGQVAGLPVVLVAVPVVMLLATALVARRCPQSLVDAHELRDDRPSVVAKPVPR